MILGDCTSAYEYAISGNELCDKNPYLFPEMLLTLLPRQSALTISAPKADIPRNVDCSSLRENSGQLWWLVHTKPRQEKKLAEQLRISGIPHYLPVVNCRSLTRGRPRHALLPLFASYLFLFANESQRRASFDTKRVVAMHPIQDQLGISEQLWSLAYLIRKGVPLRVEERLGSGQRVRVKAGILKDTCGTIIRRNGKTRLYVHVNNLLGGVSLEIDQDMLEAYP